MGHRAAAHHARLAHAEPAHRGFCLTRSAAYGRASTCSGSSWALFYIFNIQRLLSSCLGKLKKSSGQWNRNLIPTRRPYALAPTALSLTLTPSRPPASPSTRKLYPRTCVRCAQCAVSKPPVGIVETNQLVIGPRPPQRRKTTGPDLGLLKNIDLAVAEIEAEQLL